MGDTKIELRFTDATGRAQLLSAISHDGASWQLCATVDGYKFSKRCNKWQAVERTRSWLMRHSHEHQFDPALEARAS